jgi:hypothetical protein
VHAGGLKFPPPVEFSDLGQMSQKLRRWFVCMEQGALVGNRVRLLRIFSNTQHHSAITKAIHQKITEQPNAVLRMRACGHSLASFLHRCCRTAVHKTASKRSLPIQLDHADLLPGVLSDSTHLALSAHFHALSARFSCLLASMHVHAFICKLSCKLSCAPRTKL